MSNILRNFKFKELVIDESEWYLASITGIAVVEEENKLRVWVELDEMRGSSFMFSCRISRMINSTFYHFCRNMSLIDSDNRVHMEALERGEAVYVRLKEVDNGVYLVSDICWAEEEEEE